MRSLREDSYCRQTLVKSQTGKLPRLASTERHPAESQEFECGCQTLKKFQTGKLPRLASTEGHTAEAQELECMWKGPSGRSSRGTKVEVGVLTYSCRHKSMLFCGPEGQHPRTPQLERHMEAALLQFPFPLFNGLLGGLLPPLCPEPAPP